MSKTITSVLGQQEHELIEIASRKLLVILGEVAGTVFAIVPGWYVGNEKYEDNKLTAVDVELVDKLEQTQIEQIVLKSLERKGGKNFRVSFWGASDFQQDPEFSENSPQHGANRARILVVDDDPGIREIVKLHLEREGYIVETASSTGQAARLLRSQTDPLPNLMLLDIMLPDATGWQLLLDFENDPRVNKIPVIAISGLEKSSLGKEYDSKMLYDYLVKPFSMDELSRAVRKFSRL